MTHQPPIPDAATSPYPLHPDPIPEEQKRAAAAAAAEAEARAEPSGGISPAVIGVGAAIGIGAAAAVTGLLYARRRGAEAKATPEPKSRPKRKSGGDDKSKRGPADRRRVAISEPYEVSYFARKHGISAAQARDIIREAGPDRKAANALAKARKKP